MRKKISLILTLSFLILSLSGCSNKNDTITKTGFFFDTVITITLYDASAAEALDQCFVMAQHYEDLFSANKENSDIWKINHSNGTPVTVAPETIALLQKGIDYSAISNGSFDITVGRLSSLWDFSQNSRHDIPTEEERNIALASIDYRNIQIMGNTVTLLNPDIAIDLGGIAKGYIADAMKEYLLNNNVTSGLINLGGNVLCVGPKATNPSSYTIAIQKPFSEDGEASATIQVTDASVVTSGIYQRYFEDNGVIYHHILDLRNGYPCDNELASVTIISSRSVDCDALSTMVFLMGLNQGMEYIEEMTDTEAVFIKKDGSILHTSGVGTKIPFQEL